MTNMEIAETILAQLGGRRFIVFTGAKNLTAIKNGLQFHLPRNAGKVNCVQITLNGCDLYDMRFLKVSLPRFNNRTLTLSEYKEIVIKEYNDVYFDSMQELFTKTTQLYTHF